MKRFHPSALLVLLQRITQLHPLSSGLQHDGSGTSRRHLGEWVERGSTMRGRLLLHEPKPAGGADTLITMGWLLFCSRFCSALLNHPCPKWHFQKDKKIKINATIRFRDSSFYFYNLMWHIFTWPVKQMKQTLNIFRRRL